MGEVEQDTSSAPVEERNRVLEEKELTRWKALLCVAQAYQKKNGNAVTGANVTEGRWDTNIRALDGDFNSRLELGEEAVDVNVTHATVQTLFSPLWTTEPYITIQPTCAKYQDGDEIADNIRRARLTEYEINYWMRELGFRHVVKKCIFDCVATNQGFAYWGYVQKKIEIETSEGESTEPEPQIAFKKPFVKRMCPKYVLFPPGHYDFEECPWFALGFLKLVSDVRDRYDVKDIKAEIKIDDKDLDGIDGLDTAGRDYLKDDAAGYVWVWQVWDKRTTKLVTLTLGHDDALAYEDWPIDVEGFPSVKLRFTWTPDQQFGMPSMSAWLPQQKELNAARTTTSKRESRVKSVVFMNDLPEGVEDAYKKAGDGTIVNLKASDVEDIRKVIFVDPGLPAANSAYNHGSISIQDLLLISGLGAQQRGQGDPNIDSATASALVDKWAQIRQTDFGDAVRTFYLENAKKLWMILKQFPDVKRDMYVMGPEGALQQITYTLKELRGEFQFTMDLSALYNEDPATRQRNAVARYSLMAADPLVRREKLIADVFESFNKHDIESYLTTLLSPDEELMKMMNGLPAQANELDDHQGHLQAHELQAQQLEKAFGTADPMVPNDQITKIRTALFLLVAHVNDHARLIAEMDTKKAEPKQAGNAVRDAMAPEKSNETPAEMKGETVGGAVDVQTPGGVAVS